MALTHLFWFNEVTSQDFAMALNISLLFRFTIVLTSYFANPSIIHLICVCVHQINNLLLHELNQKWFHNATTYILLLHCKCTNCEKSSKLECGMYILDFFFMKWQVEANHMRNLTADMIWMIFLKLQTYSKPNLWNVTIIEYIVFEDLKCLT